MPVFRKEHAQVKDRHDPEKWARFSGKIVFE
jgi:hypothetical protein